MISRRTWTTRFDLLHKKWLQSNTTYSYITKYTLPDAMNEMSETVENLFGRKTRNPSIEILVKIPFV